MAVDSFSHSSEDVLKDLDPLSRALLDLSLQRGMDDAEIADVLGTDEESVLEVRIGLLRSLADKVAPEYADVDDVHELKAVVADRLYADKAAEEQEIAALEAAVPEPESEAAKPESASPAAARPAPEQPRARRSPLAVLLPLLLLIAGIVVIVLITNSGSEGTKDASKPTTQAPAATSAKPETKAATTPKAHAVRLTAVGAGTASGNATLDGRRLKLELRGLPSAHGGSYRVWLYNSVIDAKPIGTPRNAKLTSDAKRYRFVDVSIEPPDGNANHSGESVLRIPLKTLEAR